MNERIRELAEQADRWAQKMARSDDPRYGDRPVSDLFNEKFAELIVRDCAVTAGLMEHEGRSGIGAQILDNFGVES